jgi:SAM-dependent methyltransferase
VGVDPLSGSAWNEPRTVAGFVRSNPNPALIEYARRNLSRESNRLLDVGCGAARNSIALAELGWDVIGTDLSWPMLQAAAERPVRGRLGLALAPMDGLPIRDRSVDFVVAHGIWNLAKSGYEFRRGIAEAARVSRQGGALFVFTFSRSTLPPAAQPVEGESFVYTHFSGHPQCFVTAEQLLDELHRAGFSPDGCLPLRELNRPPALELRMTGVPVIYQGGFRYR